MENQMTLFYRMCAYLLLFLLAMHLLVRYAEAQEVNQLDHLKEMMCSQSASLEVHKLGKDDHEAEKLYAEVFNKCMEVLKDVPTIHS